MIIDKRNCCKRLVIFYLMSLFVIGTATSQTIAEKKLGIVSGTSELSPEMQKFLVEVNKELLEKQRELRAFQGKVLELYRRGAPPKEYRQLLVQMNEAKENIHILQTSWREMVTQPGKYDEGYALWHQPDTTLEQLVIDYGSSDYVYLITPEVGDIQLSVSSNIPIPYASWGEMLEQILKQNGVGIRELNPYLRELYLIEEDLSTIRLITSDRADLEVYPGDARVSFVISPEPMDVQRIWYFLEKFVNHNNTVLQRIGRVILVVGDVSSVKDLLKIYDFVTANKRELEYRAVPLYRVDAEEMTKILSAIFEEFQEEITVEATTDEKKQNGGLYSKKKRRKSGEINALNVIALPKVAQAVFLVGTKEEIQKAVDIIQEVEGQVGDAREREIFWYNVQHSDPEELAEVLSKIYEMMIENRIMLQSLRVIKEEERRLQEDVRAQEQPLLPQEPPIIVTEPPLYEQSYYQQGGFIINPRPIVPGLTEERPPNLGRDNFIVDPKTGSLVMVVEKDLLPKIKDVIKKLDVPKKMVQIEVLLFDKRLNRTNEYGLNLLKIGSKASQEHISSLCWNDVLAGGKNTPANRGILDLFFSRKKSDSGIPAYDLSYKFLMSQQDVHINAAPSVVTMNQTPAVIAIMEEISVNTGTFQVETTGGTQLQDAFTRAQYGITISVTPTIHSPDEEQWYEDPTDYIGLVCDITFDTIVSNVNQQPDVVRRHVTNETRIADGQTVIIGGLRRRTTNDKKEQIPFLGEIPCLGKLFSITSLQEDTTEMFIFITPKIISDPVEDFARLRRDELCKRPGDLPCFLRCLHCALEREKNRLFQGYMTILFGRPNSRYICVEGEYDGR